MSDKLKRREFLKLAGTAALAASATGLLSGCGGSGPRNPLGSEDLHIRVRDAIVSARDAMGWGKFTGANFEVAEMSTMAAARNAQYMAGENPSAADLAGQPVGDANGYVYMPSETCVEISYHCDRYWFTEGELKALFRAAFSKNADLYQVKGLNYGIAVTEKKTDDGQTVVWCDVVFGSRA